MKAKSVLNPYDLSDSPRTKILFDFYNNALEIEFNDENLTESQKNTKRSRNKTKYKKVLINSGFDSKNTALETINKIQEYVFIKTRLNKKISTRKNNPIVKGFNYSDYVYAVHQQIEKTDSIVAIFRNKASADIATQLFNNSKTINSAKFYVDKIK